MNYNIRYIELQGKISDIIFDFGPDYELLSVFLASDVSPAKEMIKSIIDDVLSGKSKYEVYCGNVCRAEINPSNTKIYDNLADDAEGKWCELGTIELRKLIVEWCDEVDKLSGHEQGC